MTIKETLIKDLLVIEPQVFADDRGYFMESYNKKTFQKHGLNYNFVQDNRSKSQKGVLRGLHYQVGADAQAKLVEVLQGSVFDVAVDIREDSPTFGQWYGLELSAQNKLQMLVPRGFAHGFLVLEDETIFAYKCDNFYAKSAEGGIHFQDPNIQIEWPSFDDYILSEKDQLNPFLGEHRKSEVRYE